MAKRKTSKPYMMKGERGFHFMALVVMILLTLFCILPLILMLSVSFSAEEALVKGYRFIPEVFSLSAYQFMWVKRATIFRAYGLTILVTVIGTAGNLLITSLFAYPLSR